MVVHQGIIPECAAEGLRVSGIGRDAGSFGARQVVIGRSSPATGPGSRYHAQLYLGFGFRGARDVGRSAHVP